MPTAGEELRTAVRCALIRDVRVATGGFVQGARETALPWVLLQSSAMSYGYVVIVSCV